ncbi:MAG TPA: hypothetical protein VGV17_02910 [Bosea sp. (in: a-proteobacteria)]|uniref:hypothetical protein n=1 Tax=Bosea sp. (in: a-proteobacteria) TaxID=1871050 RepID=UPI002DDD6626|nr:hypothetical protein [Bosea sp. (in: a-proteobacteria)]HEV2552695.1 hypothetical protein [Bosea sp. (in: a-proteobacteria)]
MKNPRRAYDAEGREIAPATVGTERAAGVREAEIWCGDCHHHAEVSTDGMPAELPIPDICLRYRCSACGGRNLTSRPGVIAHYAVLQEKTGMSHGNAPIPRRVHPAGGPAMPNVVITTVEEYEAATREVQDLTGTPEGSREELRLIALVEAIEAWDAKHDDATAWRD